MLNIGAEFKKSYILPYSKYKDFKSSNYCKGFLDPIIHKILVYLTLFSLHHFLQSIFRRIRYLITDLYCSAWFIAGIGIFLLFTKINIFCIKHSLLIIQILFIYRLGEIISRELWVLFYREKNLTSASRVLIIALLNYWSSILFFAYLYNEGHLGYKKSILIGLTFSPSDTDNLIFLELFQSVYCITYISVLIAFFVSRISK